MSLKIKINASADDVQSSIEELKNEELKDWARQLTQLDGIEVKWANSDGYDTDDNCGIQIAFAPTDSSSASHELNCLSFDTLMAIANHCKSGNSKIAGFECELHAQEDEFHLIAFADCES